MEFVGMGLSQPSSRGEGPRARDRIPLGGTKDLTKFAVRPGLDGPRPSNKIQCKVVLLAPRSILVDFEREGISPCQTNFAIVSVNVRL